MSRRHTQNSKLTLHVQRNWQGLNVNTRRGPLVHEYLEGIYAVMRASLAQYSRTLVARADLHFPADRLYSAQGAISRFWESARAVIAADLKRRGRRGVRIHQSSLRYVWVRERKNALNSHYHIAIFLNANTYRSLGGYSPHDVGLAFLVQRSWASALCLASGEANGLVHFPENPLTVINAYSPEGNDQFCRVFYRLSYLAKVATKEFGDGERSFGSSRCR